MDGPHDLGGKQGFGPVETDETDEPFHHDWEARMWGLSRCGGVSDWTIDWWRHIRELIDPVDYLDRPYFDSWAQTELAAYIDSGVISLDELASGKADRTDPRTPSVLTVEDALNANRRSDTRFSREIDDEPIFNVGDTVRAVAFGHGGHTRLPAYVRGRPGKVEAQRGAHLLPDDGARGVEKAEHLYSVCFQASDLWAEEHGRRDRIYLDLWESYLDPA